MVDSKNKVTFEHSDKESTTNKKDGLDVKKDAPETLKKKEDFEKYMKDSNGETKGEIGKKGEKSGLFNMQMTSENKAGNSEKGAEMAFCDGCDKPNVTIDGKQDKDGVKKKSFPFTESSNNNANSGYVNVTTSNDSIGGSSTRSTSVKKNDDNSKSETASNVYYGEEKNRAGQTKNNSTSEIAHLNSENAKQKTSLGNNETVSFNISKGQLKSKNLEKGERVMPSMVNISEANQGSMATNIETTFASLTPEQRVAQVNEVVAQMIDSMIAMEKSGDRETTITLKFPPIFEGVKVTITEFKSAPKEFNITLTNLTQQTKALIDNPLNMSGLKHAMEGKGFALHIVISTTETEIATSSARQGKSGGHGSDSGESSQDGSNQQGQGRGGSKGRRR